MIDEDLRSIIEPKLRVGEKLIWAGEPQSGVFLILVFAVVWCTAFIMFFFIPLLTAVVTNDPASLNMTINNRPVDENTSIATLVSILVFIAFSILTVGIASYWYYGRLKNQTYAVTNQRGVVFNKKWPKNTVSITQEKFSELTYNGNVEKGTVTFLRFQSRWLTRWYFPAYSHLHYKFHKIKNPKEVETLIRRTLLSK